MPGQVALNDLQTRTQQNTLTDEHRTFLAFCDLVGAPLQEIASINRFETMTAKFEAASNKISREIFRYWSQNKHLRVIFLRDAAEPGDPAPFNQGHIFRTRIYNQLHEVTVPFDDRSAGFVWFFSFLVVFSQVKKQHGENVIILLDEPGLNLHARAQADLLRYMHERLAPSHQIVYTTHSPFMVPAEDLMSVRLVEDVVIERGEDAPPEVHGTKVRSDVLSVGRDTLFPLQGALGFEITQTLFVGKHNLIVEGPSDLVYLRTYSEELRARGRLALDQRWTIVPVGGLEKVGAFMSLFGANNLNMAALVDLGQGQKRKVEELRKHAELLGKGRVFEYAAYVAQPEADVEDVIGADGYVDLVNKTYELTGADTIALPAGAPRPGRVVKFIEEQMRTRPSVPEFNHFTPAEHLALNRNLLAGLPGSTDALDRFEQMFTGLNSVLPPRG